MAAIGRLADDNAEHRVHLHLLRAFVQDSTRGIIR
jgi:hypothetical protein